MVLNNRKFLKSTRSCLFQTYNKIKGDVKDSAKKALATCKEVFKDEPWNCEVNERKLLVQKGKQIIAFSGNILPGKALPCSSTYSYFLLSLPGLCYAMQCKVFDVYDEYFLSLSLAFASELALALVPF